MSTTEPQFEEGRRVVVKIAHPEAYAGGAAESLNGRAGTVELVKSTGASETGYLVAFDEPAPPWHANSRPHAAFWFEARDLIAEEPAHG